MGLVRTAIIASQPMYFDRYRNLAMGLVMIGPGLGRFLFPVGLSRLISEYGWRGSMLFSAAFFAQCFVAAAALIDKSYNKRRVYSK